MATTEREYLMKQRKKQAKMKEVEEKFERRLRIKVDTTHCDIGWTKDGNTLQHFFAYVSVCAEIAEVDEGRLRNFATNLNAINRSQKARND